jgi:hypothetical protein
MSSQREGIIMSGTLTIPMPATCTAWYLVHWGLDPEQARGIALGEVQEHASGVMRELITELVEASEVSFGSITEQDLEGMTEEQRSLILDPHGWVSVKVQSPTRWWPDHEWAARTLAGMLGWSSSKMRRAGGLVLGQAPQRATGSPV